MKSAEATHLPEAGVLVRKLRQLSGLTPGVSYCSVESVS